MMQYSHQRAGAVNALKLLVLTCMDLK